MPNTGSSHTSHGSAVNASYDQPTIRHSTMLANALTTPTTSANSQCRAICFPSNRSMSHAFQPASRTADRDRANPREHTEQASQRSGDHRRTVRHQGCRPQMARCSGAPLVTSENGSARRPESRHRRA